MYDLTVILSEITKKHCITERYPPLKSENLTYAILPSHLSNT